MLDEATRQVEAQVQFVAQENVLHEQLAALNVELAEARELHLSAAQWEAALPCMKELSDAVARCRARLRELTQVNSNVPGARVRPQMPLPGGRAETRSSARMGRAHTV
jgi:hypothetical protein